MRTTFGLALFIVTLLTSPLSAQTLEDVFDDGVQASARNVVRTNFAAFYRKEATLSYERLTRNQMYGLEAGFGVGLGGFRPDPITKLFGTPEYDLTDAASVNSLFLNGRMYKNGFSRTSYFFKLGIRSQGFRYEDPAYNSFRFTDLVMGAGLHLLAFDRVTVDPYFDGGFRFMGENAMTELQKRDPSLIIGFEILYQLGLEVGYLF